MAPPALKLVAAPSGQLFEADNNLDIIYWDAPSKKWKTGPGGGAGLVTSVFGRTGAVVAVAGDYGSDKITNQSLVTGATLTNALDNLRAADIANGAPLKATYYVDPSFAGTSTGSQSNPFTSIASAFTYALAQGITKATIFLPLGDITENVVFPVAGGTWEISGVANGVVASTGGSRIIGTITCDTTGVSFLRLSNLSITGNTSGNAPNGTAILLTETAVRQNGSITLTQSGTGTNNLFLRGIGNPSASKQGGSNTLLVSVAGIINAENWVLEGGFNESSLSSFTPYPGSQFQACWFGSTSGSPIPIGLNALALNCAFYDCIFVGPTTFTASVSNYVIYMDGASLTSLLNPIAGVILVGTGILLKTLGGNVSAKNTIAGNVGSTAFGARNQDGIYEVVFDNTILVAGTTGSLQLNAIYTDMTGTLVTVPVGGTLNIASAAGTKSAGSLIFRHNGAAAPIAFSYTGVVTPGAMSVAASVALMCRS